MPLGMPSHPHGKFLWVTSSWHYPKYVADNVSFTASLFFWLFPLVIFWFSQPPLELFAGSTMCIIEPCYPCKFSSSQLSVSFSLSYAENTSRRTLLWSCSVIWLLAGTLDMASFYFPEHMKTLENSRRLVSSELSLAHFTQTWHDMKACLSGGCWTESAFLIGLG